ncbi:hypothetical protein [Methylobacterium sp. J-090]|uniref:hypothetical protein n=1 Tax=Methylobacterium sp. J-090 TaxID=2836666 RepID=UPI001FBA6D24|nr:hypothetical protein [Methylobacterium sp. J-090]MCJ2082695.1 hypothetical protein [Methylobacterium sp. J-090]
MTEAERQILENARSACLASADAIAAILAGASAAPIPTAPKDAFVPLKTAAAAWGVGEDAARKRVKRLKVEASAMVTKRNGGRWWVHREALL